MAPRTHRQRASWGRQDPCAWLFSRRGQRSNQRERSLIASPCAAVPGGAYIAFVARSGSALLGPCSPSHRVEITFPAPGSAQGVYRLPAPGWAQSMSVFLVPPLFSSPSAFFAVSLWIGICLFRASAGSHAAESSLSACRLLVGIVALPAVGTKPDRHLRYRALALGRILDRHASGASVAPPCSFRAIRDIRILRAKVLKRSISHPPSCFKDPSRPDPRPLLQSPRVICCRHIIGDGSFQRGGGVWGGERALVVDRVTQGHAAREQPAPTLIMPSFMRA